MSLFPVGELTSIPKSFSGIKFEGPLRIIIIIIMFVYYSCSQNATTEPTSVTQDSTDTIERKASIYSP